MEKDKSKALLRKKYKALRKTLSKEECEAKNLAIANTVARLDIWDYEYYHIFLPIIEQKEINTEYILHVLQGKDKQLVVSKSDFSTKHLQHFLLTDSTRIKTNSYGIPEPVGGVAIDPQWLDVVFIPLLAYDQTGNRIGYGQGFYDRFLAQCLADVLKIGLSYFGPEPEILPALPTDIALDCCVTGEATYVF